MSDTLKLVLVSLIIASFFGFIAGSRYGENKAEQNALERQREEDQAAVEEQKNKEEYDLILNEICSRTASESSALDLRKCKALREDEWWWFSIFPYLGTEGIREELDSYGDASLCNRSIFELNLIEIVDCLSLGEVDSE